MDRLAKSSRPTPGIADRVVGWARTRSARYQLGRWGLAVSAGLVAALVIVEATSGAESARAAWGRSTAVVVARTDLDTGDLIRPESVSIEELPVAIVPPGAMDSPPVGRRVVAPTRTGEIIVEHRLANEFEAAVSKLLPPGTRGIVVDRSQLSGEVGTVLDLHSAVSGGKLARAVIVATAEDTVTAAVPAGLVAAVIDELSRGGVIGVLAP